MQYNNKIKILQWNAQSITNAADTQQLQLLLNDHSPDIVMIAKTWLKNHLKFYLINYKVYRNDRNSDRGGGVAIAVRKYIKHTLLTFVNTTSIENISISVEINNKENIFTSAYCPKYSINFEADIKKFILHNKEFFIFDDLNARNTA